MITQMFVYLNIPLLTRAGSVWQEKGWDRGLPVLGCRFHQNSFLLLQHTSSDLTEQVTRDSLVVKQRLPGPLLLVLLLPQLRLPAEQSEVVVRLVRPSRQLPPLLRQLLRHGPDVVTLHPAAASDDSDSDVKSLPGKPGRLPASDLTGLQGWE